MDTQALPTSTQLYRRAAGVKPTGAPASKDCTCIMCGAKLGPGDLVNPILKDTFGDSFNNKLDMHRKGDVLCGDCDALWSKDFLQKYSKTYATTEGVFKLASNLDVQAFILTPPRPPFVAIINTRQQQHMIWRTPVCLSPDILIVRMDDEILKVDRAKVLAAVSAWQYVVERMKHLGMKGVPAYPDRTLSSRATGSIRGDVATKIGEESAEGAKAIAALRALRVGEWWAMTAMNKVDLNDPASWPLPEKLLSPA